MKTRRKINKSSDERGIALIMTLGILSMLLVLALAFASSARTERKVAAANADAKKAQLIAEGALDRVIALANYKSLGEVGDFYGEESYQDWIINIRTKGTDGEVIYYPTDPLSITNTYSSSPSGDNIRWNNVKVNNEIVGRFAYKVVGMPAWIDPAACVEQGTSASVEGASNEDRYGKCVYEMNLNNLAPTTGAWTSIVSKFSSSIAGGNLTDTKTTPYFIPGTARWGDFDNMCALIGITGADKEQCRKWFVMNTSPDPEAFWVDDNNDKVRDDATELYHRFNLNKYTDSNTNDIYDTGEPIWWDDPDGDGQTAAMGTDGPDHVNLLVGSKRSNYTAAESGGINWFYDATQTITGVTPPPAATFASTGDRINQIAANLLDYCDADSMPTSDIAPSTWSSANVPKYTGNELSYYLNEVAVDIETTLSKSVDSGTGIQTNTYTMDAILYCEAIRLHFFPPPPNTLTATIEASVTCSIKHPDTGDWVSKTIDLNGAISLSITSTTTMYGTLTASMPGPTILEGTSNTDLDNPEIKDIDFNIKSIILNDGTQNVDYAYINSSYSAKKGNKLTVNTDGTSYLAFSIEVDDSRQNLNTGDWYFNYNAYNDTSDVFAVADMASTTNSIGLMNSESNPMAPCPTRFADSQDYDKEDKPYMVSTAYTANSPISSPWELGVIHRGAAWQTLNMDKYNTSGYMGSYRDGDANLFDQIKMTKETSEYGKFNINSGNKDALRVLTMGISTHAKPNAPIGAWLIDQAMADQLANAISGESTRGTWNKRSEITQVAALSDSSVSSQLNDAAQEEIIGKFINLCKAGNTENSDIGTMAFVIIYAQSIKDIGPPAGNSITLNKDLDFDGVIGTADEEAVGFDINGDGKVSNTTASGFPNLSETISGCEKGSYQPYADEITSEAKIIGLIEQDAITSKWKLIRYEFANQ